MSRIGKQPIAIPSGVEVKLEGNLLKFKKGNLAKELDTKANVNVEIKDNNILFLQKVKIDKVEHIGELIEL